MKITFDGSEQSKKGGQYKPLKPGDYEFIITDVEDTTSKNGNPMVVVSFEIPTDSFKYRCVDRFVTNHEVAISRLKDLFITCQLIDKDGTGEMDTDELTGSTGFFNVGNEEFNGKTYLRVQHYITEWENE